MIPAHKGPWFNRWFAGQAGGRIKKTFGRVYTRNLQATEALGAEGSVLLVSNHSAWWDSLFIIWLVNGPIHLDGYAMMDARNLRKLPFLGKVGAFGVELGHPGDGQQAVAYAVERLAAPGAMVLVYPQGEERPLNARPLGFRSGAAAIALEASAGPTPISVVPLAARYVFGPRAEPDAWLSFGEPQPLAETLEAERARQAHAVEVELDRIERALANGSESEGFEVLHRQQPGPVARGMERMLAAGVRAHLRMTGRSLAGPDQKR